MGSNNDISLKALAKINLGLDVVRRREDGYHEVRMIMQTIHLYDRLDIKRTKEPGIQIQTNLSFLPVNENNLIYKAAKLLMDEFSITDGVSVKLDKRIPVAAGTVCVLQTGAFCHFLRFCVGCRSPPVPISHRATMKQEVQRMDSS